MSRAGYGVGDRADQDRWSEPQRSRCGATGIGKNVELGGVAVLPASKLDMFLRVSAVFSRTISSPFNRRVRRSN
jgi:hypothetical protein